MNIPKTVLKRAAEALKDQAHTRAGMSQAPDLFTAKDTQQWADAMCILAVLKPPPKFIDFRHDVARLRSRVGADRHIIMRDKPRSLCKQIITDQQLDYVGVWDSGEKPTCPECKRLWAIMRKEK